MDDSIFNGYGGFMLLLDRNTAMCSENDGVPDGMAPGSTEDNVYNFEEEISKEEKIVPRVTHAPMKKRKKKKMKKRKRNIGRFVFSSEGGDDSDEEMEVENDQPFYPRRDGEMPE